MYRRRLAVAAVVCAALTALVNMKRRRRQLRELTSARGAPPGSHINKTWGTLTLYHLLPLAVQHWMRDHGITAVLADLPILCAGAGLLVMRPSLREIYLTSFTAEAQYAPHSRQTLDMFAAGRRRQGGAPILVFVHGGAWGFGNKFFYRGMGHHLAQLAITTVIPDYHKYPEGDANSQMMDVARALHWICTHGARLGDQSSPIFLCGHSSGTRLTGEISMSSHTGAHVASLLLLRAAKGLLPPSFDEHLGAVCIVVQLQRRESAAPCMCTDSEGARFYWSKCAVQHR